jgi:hypothetical protein
MRKYSGYVVDVLSEIQELREYKPAVLTIEITFSVERSHNTTVFHKSF